MKLLTVLTVLAALSCTEALRLRRQLGSDQTEPKAPAPAVVPKAGPADQAKSVANAGGSNPTLAKGKPLGKVPDGMPPSDTSSTPTLAKGGPRGPVPDGKPPPVGKTDTAKEPEAEAAADICKTELGKAGDFLKQLEYTPTPGCCANTMYMQAQKSKGFITDSAKNPKCKDAGQMVASNAFSTPSTNAAMFVIDMQNDFTTGSFKLPCEGPRKNKLATAIAKEMIRFAKDGGLVVRQANERYRCPQPPPQMLLERERERESLSSAFRQGNTVRSHLTIRLRTHLP